MVPVSLFDHIELDLISSGISLSCHGISVPNDEKNLVFRAACAFFTRTGLKQGASIKLTKHIPVAAGLGGGSSDAAATLKALNEMCPDRLSPGALKDLAVTLGADVPFFLQRGPCIARGIGEILEPIENWPRLWYVIVTPPIEVSTAWVYKNLKLELTTEDYDYIINSLQKRCFEVGHLLENDLEAVTGSHFPVIDRIKKSLADEGAEGTLMSGSGPSVFGIFKSEDQAMWARKKLINRNLGRVFAVEGVI